MDHIQRLRKHYLIIFKDLKIGRRKRPFKKDIIVMDPSSKSKVKNLLQFLRVVYFLIRIYCKLTNAFKVMELCEVAFFPGMPRHCQAPLPLEHDFPFQLVRFNIRRLPVKFKVNVHSIQFVLLLDQILFKTYSKTPLIRERSILLRYF